MSQSTASQPTPRFETEDRTITGGDAGRGRFVFAAANCASCHATPGQSDPLNLGGGLALASPFGTFRVPNISQDPVDGIGSWSAVDLANALISGISPAGEPAFPLPQLYWHAHRGDQGSLCVFGIRCWPFPDTRHARPCSAVPHPPPSWLLEAFFSMKVEPRRA